MILELLIFSSLVPNELKEIARLSRGKVNGEGVTTGLARLAN